MGILVCFCTVCLCFVFVFRFRFLSRLSNNTWRVLVGDGMANDNFSPVVVEALGPKEGGDAQKVELFPAHGVVVTG